MINELAIGHYLALSPLDEKENTGSESSSEELALVFPVKSIKST